MPGYQKGKDFINHNFKMLERLDIDLPVHHKQTSQIKVSVANQNSEILKHPDLKN